MNCSIPGCEEPVFVKLRGWCKNHYLRWWRNGSPTAGKYHVHHGMARTPIHNMWSNIKARIFNPKSEYYYCYGGRGISMHQPWKDDFMSFYNYIITTLGEHPGNGYSIDRIDNDGNYEPGNLRWATSAQQSVNKRNTKNTSGYRGVKWKKKNKKWEVSIRAAGKDMYLGLFDDPEIGALEYDCAAIQLHGDYAKRNIL